MKVLSVVQLGIALGGDLSAQGVTSVGPGFGVDLEVPAWSESRWHAEVASIYDAWREYLLSDPHLQAPTALWSAEEQERWPGYDLTAGIAYVGVGATVLDIRPVEDGSPGEFQVRTLFATRGGPDSPMRPVALTRVTAFRERGAWVFSNAISHLTRDWGEEQVGPIRYRFPHTYPFERERAERAIVFADSLAATLDLPPLEAVTYYVAASPQEMLRAMGIDWTFGGQGHGMAFPWNRLILSGDPEFGEEHRHELTHLVLGPLLAEGRVHRLVNEGLATWYGGSMGSPFPDVIRLYATYLRDHPGVTLDSVLSADGPDRGVGPAGAVVVEMVSAARGIEGIRELLSTGRSDDALKEALRSLLEADWSEINDRWRQTVLAFGEPGDHRPEPR